MSRLNAINLLCRKLLNPQRNARKIFGAISDNNGIFQTRNTSTLPEKSLKDPNIIYSPFGDVEECTETLTQYLCKEWESHGDAPAITCGVTGRTYNYSFLRMMIDKFAKASLGVLKLKPGDTVGLILPNIPEFLIVAYGALEAGLRVTCANPLFTPDELARQFSNCDVDVVITIDMFLPKVEAMKKSLPSYKSTVVISEEAKSGKDIYDLKQLLFSKNDMELPNVDINSIALIPYSSGTTGLPKGVLLTHKNLVTNIVQYSNKVFQKYDTKELNRCTVLTVPPFFHIYGFNGILNFNLKASKHVVTLPRFVPEDYIKCLAHYKPKTLFVVPSLLAFLASHPGVTKEHLSSIEDVTIGAAPTTESILEKFLLKCGKSRDELVLQQGFGMSESSPVTLLTPYRHPASKGSSAGQIVPGTQCRIVSLTTGENLGPHKTGELLCKGPQVMQGYLKNEAATRETVDEDGWLHTGDVAYYDDDHFFYIVDRTKELIKVKGNQVSPTELENMIQEFPEIADAAVVGIPDHLAGELPKAFIVLKPGHGVTEKQIYDQVAEKVVKYKRLDGGIVFVESIPRNAAGKILRNELKVLGASISKRS